jgi:hypothetical protein
MEFFSLLSRQNEVVEEYFRAVQAANDAREKERTAATAIQSAYRASVIRGRYHDVLWAASEIERMVRGHLGYNKAKTKKLERHRVRNRQFFDHVATIIQKHFRGFWSRKYWHHMHARQKYLQTVGERGERTVAFLAQKHVEDQAAQAAESEARMRKEFKNLTAHLHHLVSTSTIPGVYNPPYSEVVPSAFGIPVETHLRQTNQVRLPASLRRPTYRSRSNPPGRRLKPIEQVGKPNTAHDDPGGKAELHSTTANVGRNRLLQGPFRTRDEQALANARAYAQYRSVQASSKYNAVRDSELMQEKLAKMTRLSADEFAHRRVAERPYLGSASAETPYMERPVEFREDYNEVPKIGNKPSYVLPMPRGKLFTDYEDPFRHITMQGGV